MINRGTHHVIFDDVEIMKRLPKPTCLLVLRQLMWFYEERSRRILYQEANRGVSFGKIQMDGIMSIELDEFNKLIEVCHKWLKPPLRIDFKEKQDETRKRQCANGYCQGHVIKIDMSET
jgi:hypothetical protein